MSLSRSLSRRDFTRLGALGLAPNWLRSLPANCTRRAAIARLGTALSAWDALPTTSCAAVKPQAIQK